MLVSFGDKIAFEDTLKGALDDLFGGNSGASPATTARPAAGLDRVAARREPAPDPGTGTTGTGTSANNGR